MGWQSQMSIAVDGGNRPTVPGQDVPASTTRRVLRQQSCCLHWARHSKKCSSEPDCGLLYVVQTAFGRVVECGRRA
jgi:hypothetical protein